MATARCPLCGGEHELETTTKGVPYVSCVRWKQSVFFNRGEGEAYLKTVEAGTPTKKAKGGDYFP